MVEIGERVLELLQNGGQGLRLRHTAGQRQRFEPLRGDRTPIDDWDTGEYIVPKGSYVFVSQYSMGRHPKYYPDPERFDPDRWTPEAIAERPRYASFPFGGGVHTCIGEHFAWAELVLIMATLAQRWTMTLIPGQTIETDPLITLRVKQGIRVTLHARNER